MKPLTDTMRERLNGALDYVLAEERKGTAAAEIIDGMVRNHRAGYGQRNGGSVYHLRCAGANTTTTNTDPRVLIITWRRNAVIRLGQML